LIIYFLKDSLSGERDGFKNTHGFEG